MLLQAGWIDDTPGKRAATAAEQWPPEAIQRQRVPSVQTYWLQILYGVTTIAQ